MLETSNLVALGAKYHHKCLQNLSNKCRINNPSSSDSEIVVCEGIAFSDLVSYMHEKINSEDKDVVFPMGTLMKMYKKRLAELLDTSESELSGIRSTTLREKIQNEFPQLLVHRPLKEYQFVCKSTDFVSIAQSEDLNHDAIAFSRFTRALRKEMEKWKTSFQGTFDNSSKKKSVPPMVLAAVNMIVFGSWSPEVCKATDPALTIAQLIMFNFKKRPPTGDTVRHVVDQESPLPMYMALQAYGNTRSRTVIDEMHRRGISVSSNRVREVTSSLCHLTIDRAEEEGLLCPSNLLRGIFTSGAYDNVDHNPSSNTSVGSFHGTSISIFQTPSDEKPGEYRNFKTSFKCDGPKTLDVPHLPDNFTTIPNVFLIQKEPKVLNPNIPCLSQMLPSDKQGYRVESDWLNHVLHFDSQSSQEGNKNNDCSWAAYHATKSANKSQHFHSAVCALLPLFAEASTSVSMLRHGMDIITNITHFLNPQQTPVMCGDQPLYTIGKLIQWNWPDLYGENKFVMMFAPFHIEKAFLGVIGQYMTGCGWISIVVNAGLTPRGSAEALLKVTYVKKSRTAHEVTVAALYKLLIAAHAADSPDVPLETWTDEKADKSPTFKFWLTLLNLEILLLSFVRSLREGNYNLFKECLKEMISWFFHSTTLITPGG